MLTYGSTWGGSGGQARIPVGNREPIRLARGPNMLPVAPAREHTEGVLSKILVAYDDSAPARRALEQAVHLARLERAGLIVIAVDEHLARLDGASIAEVKDEHQRRQDECDLWLWAAEAYAAAQGVQVGTEIRIGNFTQQLAAAAAAHQADLLVLGRPSCRGLRTRLLRTKTERLSRHVDRPLLIVSAGA